MHYIVVAFGILILLTGLILLVSPNPVFGLMQRYSDSSGLYLLAIIIRAILGIALINFSEASKFPAILLVLGWLSLAAAVVIGAIGQSKFKQLVIWGLSLVPKFGRIGGLLACLFGGFIIYAAA
ncbi:MAG: hypothetical protein QF790_10170 [Gammaproteobacteria bacterium]|nr:hypothetical protein [Gammaproteobacteria bacterium]MDP6617517.1 hypothetical protein [Gammaproteobacteria bacterium]MDP6694394.1 hypothetical protein [Gammaproteobacteria bacterium]